MVLYINEIIIVKLVTCINEQKSKLLNDALLVFSIDYVIHIVCRWTSMSLSHVDSLSLTLVHMMFRFESWYDFSCFDIYHWILILCLVYTRNRFIYIHMWSSSYNFLFVLAHRFEILVYLFFFRISNLFLSYFSISTNKCS